MLNTDPVKLIHQHYENANGVLDWYDIEVRGVIVGQLSDGVIRFTPEADMGYPLTASDVRAILEAVDDAHLACHL